MHAKFDLASTATHMRTTEHVDTDSAGRDYLLWQYPIVQREFTRSENITDIFMHAKFALASGATHMRTAEHVDTDSASRDYYRNIR